MRKSDLFAWDGPVGDPTGGVRPGGRVFQDPVSAIVSVGSSLIGGASSSDSSRKAANIQKDSAAAATAAQREMFDITRADQAPYRALASEVGLPGIRQILSQSGQLTPQQVMAEPGYQFGLDQGNRNIQGSASARGGLYSGATLKALQRFGTDYGSTKYGEAWNRLESGTSNRFNRFATAAGIGQAATNQVNAQGAQLGQNIGNNLIGAGNAGGANAISQGNAWTNALNRISSYTTPSTGGSVGQDSNAFTNRGYFSNVGNGLSNDDVYWN